MSGTTCFSIVKTLNLVLTDLWIIYIYHFLETVQTDFIEAFESDIQALARQCFHFQNGLNPSFMPTQQRPSRALTELLADQFHLIRQLTFQKLVLASQFRFARYFLRLAREVDSLNCHCLMMVAFDALFHQLDQVPRFHFSLFVICKFLISGYIASGWKRLSQGNHPVKTVTSPKSQNINASFIKTDSTSCPMPFIVHSDIFDNQLISTLFHFPLLNKWMNNTLKFWNKWSPMKKRLKNSFSMTRNQHYKPFSQLRLLKQLMHTDFGVTTIKLTYQTPKIPRHPQINMMSRKMNIQNEIIDITSDSEKDLTMNATVLDQNLTQIQIDEQVYGSDSEILSEISDQSVNSTILNPVSERRLLALQKHDELMNQIQNASWVEEEDLDDINNYIQTILKKENFKNDNPKHNSKGSAKRFLSAAEKLIKAIGKVK
ncbi:Hypothetical_protein [Hexamita inflata]|uniref:Hypothetical_protein n=2 Tax=Hexamita inflata TaxID=28002 RepID=A0AA86UBW1_9EUKA|nr:Hypothetical protein HINF_LOCUS33901 [Hexamita inflata]